MILALKKVLWFLRCCAYSLDCKLSSKGVLKAYLKIQLHYILFISILNRRINMEKIFGLNFRVLDFRSFITMFEAIFIYDEYYFSTDKEKPQIVDCGTNIGLSIIYFKMLYPKSLILSLEPDPESFSVLAANIHQNNITGVTLINKALSDKNGSVNFYIESDKSGSLLMSTFQSRVPHNRKIKVSSVRLSDIVRSFNNIDFLLSDIEGMELKVFKEIVKVKSLTKINQFIVEYHHNLEGQENCLSEFLDLLEKNNFTYQLSTFTPVTPFYTNFYQDILVYAHRSYGKQTKLINEKNS